MILLSGGGLLPYVDCLEPGLEIAEEKESKKRNKDGNEKEKEKIKEQEGSSINNGFSGYRAMETAGRIMNRCYCHNKQK